MLSSAVPPSRIAFGSCNEQDRLNKLWPIIESRRPAAFVWGGDAIYADIQGGLDWSSFPPTTKHECATPGRLRSLYRRQRNVPGYRSLLDQNITVFGTFDDHDYGCNNADRTFKFKYESAMAFVNFLNAPDFSPMRARAMAGDGVFGVKLFDFDLENPEVPDHLAGIDADLPDTSTTRSPSNRTVAVFVLDVRTNKTPWKTGADRYKPDFEGDYLGERQWQWFEQSIGRSNAAVNVIVNGLQVHAHRFPDGNVAESWGQYPRAQQRLFDTILQDGVESPILVSGDVHMAQMMRKDCSPKGYDRVQRSIVEMTTSGMTHSWGTLPTPLFDLQYKHGMSDRYLNFLSSWMIRMLHYFCPWTDVMDSNGSPENGGGEGALQGRQFSLQKNFGELEFDWQKRSVSLRVIGERDDAPPLLMSKLSMDQLSGRANIASPYLSQHDFQSEAKRNRHRLSDSDWICLNHRGRDTTLAHTVGHAASAMVLVALAPMPILLPFFLLALSLRRRFPVSDRPGKHCLRTSRRSVTKVWPKTKISKRARLSKVIPRRCKSYVSFVRQSKLDLQCVPQVKFSRDANGVRVSKMVLHKTYDRQLPQFT